MFVREPKTNRMGWRLRTVWLIVVAFVLAFASVLALVPNASASAFVEGSGTYVDVFVGSEELAVGREVHFHAIESFGTIVGTSFGAFAVTQPGEEPLARAGLAESFTGTEEFVGSIGGSPQGTAVFMDAGTCHIEPNGDFVCEGNFVALDAAGGLRGLQLHGTFRETWTDVGVGTYSISYRFGGDIPSTGARLNLLRACGSSDVPGSATLAENADFFVQHGWAFEDWSDPTLTTAVERRGILSEATRFDLLIDGNLVESMKDFGYDASRDVFLKGFLTNFAGGMTGSHLFTGHWYMDGSLVGGSYGQSVLQLECVALVTFI